MPVNLFSRKRDAVASFDVVDKNQLYPFKPTSGDGRMNLADLIGSDETNQIVASGSIEFVATGDTGKGVDTEQSRVVEAMAHEFLPDTPAGGATFFMHLGDIIYGPDKQTHYSNKFYRPNMPWLRPAPGIAGLILGIPGNHDGEERTSKEDHPSLNAFLANFCAPKPEVAKSFNVTMPNQPGPYWWLSAPFLDLIGLYSNAAEDFGALGADDRDDKQVKWLVATLKKIASERAAGSRKALVFATHHPPYNQGLMEGAGGHPGSPKMLAAIDSACTEAGVWPDMFISGHSHNYQRYTRTKTIDGVEREIPYLIAGTGGIGSQPAPPHVGNMQDNVRYDAGLGSGGTGATVYGYLRMHASPTVVQATFVQTAAGHRDDFETIAVSLTTGKRSTPEF